MICSTCDGYQLVDLDGDGVIDSACPDCRAAVVRCPVHGRTIRDGKCSSCRSEAALAEEIVVCKGLHPLAGAAA